MILKSLRTAAAVSVLSAMSALAGAPTIGVVSAVGTFTVNKTQVVGNSNLYNGSQISTGKMPGEVYLQDGSSVTLNTNSGATIYQDHVVLSQGGVRVADLNKTMVQTSGFSVVADEPSTTATVSLNQGTVEVASLHGVVKVLDSEGSMLTRIGAGTSSTFKAGQTGASGGRTSRGGAHSGGGAAPAVSGSNALLYTSTIVGLAGIGVGSAALIESSASR